MICGITAGVIGVAFIIYFCAKKKKWKALDLACNYLIAALCIALLYTSVASGNYYRDPLPVDKYEGEQLSAEETARLLDVLLDDFVAVSDQVKRNQDGSSVCPYTFRETVDLIRAEYEKSVKKFTDYKTYLVFDLIVTNEQGEEQRLSKTLLKKSGGETQIPFYIALLASFSQVCRIRSKGKNNTIRLIILDEAFSKMDGERIRESIGLLKRFGLQAIFSAPPEKIPDIAPIVDRNIAVYKSGHHSFTRSFDPAQIEEEFQ